MKRLIAPLACLCFCLTLLAGCGSSDNISFTAVIEGVYESSIRVSTRDEGLGFATASVDISGLEPDFNLLQGQTVLLTILPEIREVSPVMVTATDIQLIRENYIAGSPIPRNAHSDVQEVSMTIKPDSVTSNGLTVVITDKSDPPHTFGEWYELKVMENGRWSDVPVVIDGDYGFNDIGLEPDDNGRLELAIDWQWLYGSLEPGTYKIIKALYIDGDFSYFSAEFEIG